MVSLRTYAMGKNTKPKPEILQKNLKKEQHLRKNAKKDAKPSRDEHLQQIPFRLREIMKSKEKMKIGEKKTMRKAFVPKPESSVARTADIPVPHFRRRFRESEKAYLQRMGQAAQHVLFLTNNQLERRPELEEEQQEQPSDTRKSEKKREFDKVRQQRLQKKKTKKMEEAAEKEKFTDKVRFGEVAMAPPSLTAKPKKASSNSQGRKGLLLASLLGHSPVVSCKPSMARQRMMEEERQRVVEAYRHIKRQEQVRREARGGSRGKRGAQQ